MNGWGCWRGLERIENDRGEKLMKSASTGTGTSVSGPEVTGISPVGLRLIYAGKEYFLNYDEFPWFLEAPVQKVFRVIEEGTGHLRWPELDIDLSLDSIKRPGAFPLVYEPPGIYGQHDIKANSELKRGLKQGIEDAEAPRGGLAMVKEFNVVIELDEDGYYVASVPSLRGCHTQAKSLDTLMKRIKESIELCMEVEEPVSNQFIGVQRIAIPA